MAAFLHLLDSHIPLTTGGDWVRWRFEKNGEFACAGVVGVDHLLIHYKEAYQLWCLVFRSFGIS